MISVGCAPPEDTSFPQIDGTVLYSSDRLTVKRDESNGCYNIVYCRDGKPAGVWRDVDANTAQQLYASGDYDRLEILSDGTVLLTEEEAGGLHQYAVDADNLAVEMDTSSGSKEFTFHFLDAGTGTIAHTARVNGEVLHFLDVTASDVDLLRGLDAFETMETIESMGAFSVDGIVVNAQFKLTDAYYETPDVRNGYLLSLAYSHE